MTAPGALRWPFVGRTVDRAAVAAAVADPHVDAVVVRAPAGTGKTRLVREVTAGAAVPPLWVQASPAAAPLPYAALVAVVDLDGDEPPATVHRRLALAAADGGGVVVLDDAPHLDERSADVLRRLVDAGKATVVATARTGVAVPAWLEWLWLGERTVHHELAPLGAGDVAALVDSVLAEAEAEAEVEVDEAQRDRIVAALVRRTAGNALFVRELLADLVRRAARGEPVDADAGAPHHLLAVLARRLAEAGQPVRAVVEAATVVDGIAADLVDAHTGPDAVAAAEAAGLVVVEGGRRPRVRVAHPLHGEAALAGLGVPARRRLVEAVAAAVLADPAATAAERLAATTALVDAGLDAAVPHLVEAARVAFAALDHQLAMRLASAAVDAGDPYDALVVLGAARSALGRVDEAEAALRAALAAATDDHERARAAGRLAVHLLAHGPRVEEAATLLDAVRAELSDPEALAFLAADRAKVATLAGDLRSVPLPEAAGDGLARLNAAVVGAYVEAMAGDAAACRRTVETALPLAAEHRAVLPWTAELLRFSLTFAALGADGPTTAVAYAAAGRGEAAAAGAPTAGTWAYLEGFTAAVAGDLDRAARRLERAAAELEGHDLIGARPLAVAALAWVLAQQGRVEPARAAIDAAVGASAVDARVRTQLSVADAWCDVVEAGDRGRRRAGAPAEALAERVVASAVDAADGGQLLVAVIVLHELVRLGSAHAVLEPTRRLAAAAPASWVAQVVADRAAAEAAGDDASLARLLAAVGDRWPVVRAELWAARHRVAQTAGEPVEAARAAVRALAAVPPGAARPWTLRSVASPLSDRELAVALAVAGGAANREVAERADVSVRTVENQLQSAYRKLGTDRAGLVSLLAGA